MTDQHQQTETERQELLRRAEEMTRRRDQFTVPYTQEDLPTLTEAARQLGELAGMVQDLSQQVHLRATGGHADDSGLAAALDAYGKAAGHLSAAAGYYGSACSRLPFLLRHPLPPRDAVLRDACGNAFVLTQQDIAHARDKLASARASLAGGASDLEDEQALSRAARARSAHAGYTRCPAPAEAEPHTAAPAQQPEQAPGAARAR